MNFQISQILFKITKKRIFRPIINANLALDFILMLPCFKQALEKCTNCTMSTKNENVETTRAIVKVAFTVGEIVWAKIKGHNHWPARIISFPSQKMAEVTWYNDYRRTKLYRSQLFKFLVNFDEFAKKFDVTVGLSTAAREALMDYGQNTIFGKKM